MRGLCEIEAPFSPIIALPSGPLSNRLRAENFRVARVPLRRIQRPQSAREVGALLLYLSRTAPRLARLIRQNDVQIVHANSDAAFLVASLATRKFSSRPLVWHCRDLAPLGALGPFFGRRAAKVIAISQCVAAHLKSQGVPQNKIVVVPNALDLNEWPFSPSSHRNDFVFGAVGQFVAWKNFRAFIEAAALLTDEPNARFRLVGSAKWGDAAHARELRALVDDLDLGERFEFVAPSTNGQSAFELFDCLVHPSEREPFGRVLIEAMAFGKPVVAVDACGPGEIIDSEQDGLLVARGEVKLLAERLADAMRRVLRSPSERENWTRAARAKAENQFDFRLHAARIVEIYRDLLF